MLIRIWAFELDTTSGLFFRGLGIELHFQRMAYARGANSPFFEAWKAEGAGHWRLGGWEGVVNRVQGPAPTLNALES